jgi:hypothetical protein
MNKSVHFSYLKKKSLALFFLAFFGGEGGAEKFEIFQKFTYLWI